MKAQLFALALFGSASFAGGPSFTFTVRWDDPDRTIVLPGGAQVTIHDGEEVSYRVRMTDNVISANSDGQALAVEAQITQIGGPDFGPVTNAYVGFRDSPDFQGNPIVDELNISWDQSFVFSRTQFDFPPETVSIREFDPLDFGGPSMMATVQDFFANIPAFVDATPIGLGCEIVGLYFPLQGASLDSFTAPCDADLSGDGEVNFFDLSTFLQTFNAQGPDGDYNSDGSHNFFDLSAYLQAFNAGCP